MPIVRTGVVDGYNVLAPEARPVSVSYEASVGELPSYDMHYALELGILVQGRMRRHYTTWHMEIGPGQVWLCGVWERHGRDVLEGPCERLVFYVAPTELMSMNTDNWKSLDWMLPFRVVPRYRPQAKGEMRRQMLEVAQRARVLLGQGPSIEQEAGLLLLFLESLLTLRRGWRPALAVPSPLPAGGSEVNAVVQLVFSTKGYVTVEAAAKVWGLNRNDFSRRFRQLMGISFPEFALRHRLKGAAAQLLQTDDPLKTVARDWGFSNAAHLHRSFVRYRKMTPAQYRALGAAAAAPEE